MRKHYVLTDGHDIFGGPLWMNQSEAEDADRRARQATGGNLRWQPADGFDNVPATETRTVRQA